MLFSESNNRKSQLKGLEALSCYSSLETSHVIHRKTLSCVWGLLRAHQGDVGPFLGHVSPFPWAGPRRGLPPHPSFGHPWHLLCSGMPWADNPAAALEQHLPSAPGRAGTPLSPHTQLLQQGCSGTSDFSSLQKQAEPFLGDRMQVSARQEQHKSISHCLKIYLYTRSEPFPPESCGRNGVLKCSIIYS